MENKDNKAPARFPEEMPSGSKKNYDHGVIESVVRNEIDTKPASNPVKPCSTDNINTEFAKQAQNRN